MGLTDDTTSTRIPTPNRPEGQEQSMDEFDDFDIGPQADEFAPIDADDDLDFDIDEDEIIGDDELIDDDDDLRPYSREWGEDQDEDIDYEDD